MDNIRKTGLKMTAVLLLLSLAIPLFLMGCSAPGREQTTVFAERTVALDGREVCDAKGGIWNEYMRPSGGLLDEPYCTLPFSDYGKKCTDSDQCIGNCEPPEDFLSRENGRWMNPYRENVSGTCSKFNEGCESYQILNGILDLDLQAICTV